MKMIMERWWNDSGRGKPNYSEGKPVPVLLVLHKSHMDDVESNPGPVVTGRQLNA